MKINKENIVVFSLLLIFSSYLISDLIELNEISNNDKKPLTNTSLIELFEPIEEFKPSINVKPAKLISVTTKKSYAKRNQKKDALIAKPIKQNIDKKEAPINIKLNIRHEHNSLYIRSYNKDKVIFDISDATGFVLYKGKIKTKQQTLSLSDLLPGVYYLNARMENLDCHKKSYRFIVES